MAPEGKKSLSFKSPCYPVPLHLSSKFFAYGRKRILSLKRHNYIIYISTFIFLIIGGEPDRRRSLVRPRRRCEGNIKMYLREVGWEGIGCIWLRIWAYGGLL